MRAVRHPDETSRTKALREYGVLEAPRDERFESLVRLAAKICRVSVAFINLLDGDRQCLIAEVGVGIREAPRDPSICNFAILQKGLMEVPDILADPRFAGDAQFKEPGAMRFYAGVALLTPEGLPLGTLCVMDPKPGKLTLLQRETLSTLALQIMALLDMQRELRRLERGLTIERTRDAETLAESEFLAVITDRLPVRVAYMDTSMRYVFLNGEYERQFGFGPREAWGRSVEEIAGTQAWLSSKTYFDRALAGESSTQEISMDYAFGTRRIEARFVSDLGPDGSVRGVVVLATDVTARYEADQAIARERKELDRTLNTAEVATWKWDMAENSMIVSERLRFIFGLTREQAEGGEIDNLLRAIHPEDLPSVVEAIRIARETGAKYEVEYRVTGEDHVERWVLARGVAELNEEGGQGRFFSGILIDVTARKEAERERERLLTELKIERERLQTIFEQAPAFLALLRGPDFEFEYVNEAYFGLVGHRPLIGKTVLEAIPEVADQGFLELLRTVRESGKAFVGQAVPIILQRTPGGELERRYLDFVYQPVMDASGVVNAILAHGVDVTDQAIAREQIEQSEERFRTVFHNAPDAIVLTDTHLKIQAWNPAAAAITHWSAEEAVGQSAELIFTEEDRQAGIPFKEAVEAAAKGETLDERWHVRKDGSRFWGSGAMNALYEADGTVRGYLKVFRDATERYAMERQIRELNEDLEERVKDRTRELQDAIRESEGFNYSIAHDLRSPLRAIVATASILRQEIGANLDPSYQDMLERQAYNATRVSRLIDELLRLSRLARVEVTRETVNMTALVRSVATELDPLRAVDVQEGMRAESDPNLVRTVFQNLIGNAFKFSPEESLVTVGQTEGVFWVRDQGVGFDMQYSLRLFQPFERLVTEAEFEGTGIGLANVDRIVRRHKGRVWAESKPGQGATFYFTLG